MGSERSHWIYRGKPYYEAEESWKFKSRSYLNPLRSVKKTLHESRPKEMMRACIGLAASIHAA